MDQCSNQMSSFSAAKSEKSFRTISLNSVHNGRLLSRDGSVGRIKQADLMETLQIFYIVCLVPVTLMFAHTCESCDAELDWVLR